MLQVLSIFVYAILIAGFYAFHMPFVEVDGVRWWLCGMYGAIVIYLFYLNLRTSLIDPADPAVYSSSGGDFFCGHCQVKPPRALQNALPSCHVAVIMILSKCWWLYRRPQPVQQSQLTVRATPGLAWHGALLSSFFHSVKYVLNTLIV